MVILTPEQLDQIVSRIVARLRQEFSPVAIYLYGSYVTGRPHPGSDLDLLVVVEEDPRSPYARDAAAYLALRDIEVPLDVQVYTRAEFEKRASLPVSFERTVLQRGRVVYAA